ncbi:MAG: TlpA family protein disulfide reductase [Ignavibacteriae bacterium]|nr:TlpA family protein disulfide reductase [Ignavibacteriota bacterium]
MKKYLMVTLLIIVIASCSDDKKQKFSFVPELPKVSEEIKIQFVPEKDSLKNASELNMIVYSFGDELLNTSKIAMEKKDDVWIGKFKTENEIFGLIIKFVGDEFIDDNNQLGFVVPLFDDDENELPGYKAGLANIYQRWAATIGLKKDNELANKLFKEDFAKHPEVKGLFLNGYVSSFPKNRIDSAAASEIEKLEEKNNFTQKEFEFLANWTRNIGDHVKSVKYVEMIEKKFPESNLIKTRFLGKFRNMLTVEKKLEVFNEYLKFDKNSEVTSYMFSGIVNQQVKENDFKSAEKLLNEYLYLANSNLYNGIAWRMFETKKNLPSALQYGEKGIEIARKEVKNPTGIKPVYIDDEQWINSKKNSLGFILDTYGNIQNELGKTEAALKSFEEAATLTNGDYPELNESYVSLLYNLKQFEKAKNKSEEFISKGKSTNKIQEIFNNSFIKLGGSKDNLDKHLGKIGESVNQKMIEKLKNSILNKPAPQFKLKDLKGNSVSLSDFKGRIVIVDFWATWCGPCLQSFPIMQKAVDKFEKSKNVKFLFVNTWERVEDKLKNASDFIEKNKYLFHVLLDDQNEVIDNYGVEGIPTKFIIDKNGNIRFKSVGLEGTEKEILAELDQMITMIE